MALELAAGARVRVPTPELNRALEEAVARLQPPMGGRRRAKLYYAAQVSETPVTILVFVNDPSLIPESYRRYLASFFRKRFGVRSAPVRVHFRSRGKGRGGESDAGRGDATLRPDPGGADRAGRGR